MTAAISLAVTASQGASAGGSAVREFALRKYFHGIPYEDARMLGPGALPELDAMLHDESLKASWPNIVTIVAYIGTPASFRMLRDFMWNRFTGDVDDQTWRALINVPNMMGVISNPRAEVIAYLEKGADPSFWRSVPWTYRLYPKREDLLIVLSKMSINGLATTGSSRAAVVLSALRQKPYTRRQLPNIIEGIGINREVSEKGFAYYAERKRAELGAGNPRPGRAR